MLLDSMELSKKSMGAASMGYSVAASRLARFYQGYKNDFARAEPLLTEVVRITRNMFGDEHPFYARSLTDLGDLYREMGDYGRAESILRDALSISKRGRRSGEGGDPGILKDLGLLYWSKGDYVRAEPFLREALEIDKKAKGEDPLRYSSQLLDLGGFYEEKGDYSLAFQFLDESYNRLYNYMRDSCDALGERQRQRMLDHQRAVLNSLLSLALRTGAGASSLYRRVLDVKEMAASTPIEAYFARDQPELKPLVEKLALTRSRLSHLAFSTAVEFRGDFRRKQLDELIARKETLEADLARRSAVYRRRREAKHSGPVEIAASLPEDTALVEFVLYRPATTPEGGQQPRRTEFRLLAFVLRRGRPLALIQLGAAGPIEAEVAAWSRSSGQRREEALKASAELGRRVWDPLRASLDGARVVLLAPDGRLSGFPFAVLPGRRPGSYLLEEIAIGYVASGMHVVELLAGLESTAGRGLLAVGDVNFQANPGAAQPSLHPAAPSLVVKRAGFLPLPGTGGEAAHARDLFHTAFADQPAILLTKGEPTEGEIKRRLDGGRWRVIHLATHGFFESPDRVAALRKADQENSPAIRAKLARDDVNATVELMPLLRSGVVLAGGGRAPDPGQSSPSIADPPAEDGILTAEEVKSLDLRGTVLVVLSACDTGLGVLGLGEGFSGLKHAFHAAGARAVVASLWKVDDAATSVLMERFYTNLWVKKMSRLEALREAQLAVLNDPGLVRTRRAELARRGVGEKPKKLPDVGPMAPMNPRDARSDPSLWAAFVLSGDGR